MGADSEANFFEAECGGSLGGLTGTFAGTRSRCHWGDTGWSVSWGKKVKTVREAVLKAEESEIYMPRGRRWRFGNNLVRQGLGKYRPVVLEKLWKLEGESTNGSNWGNVNPGAQFYFIFFGFRFRSSKFEGNQDDAQQIRVTDQVSSWCNRILESVGRDLEGEDSTMAPEFGKCRGVGFGRGPY